MKIFKIILGTLILALGLGVLAAGWAVAVYGQHSQLANVLFGFTFGFMGLGLGWAGLMLLRGSTVRDALGGMVTARLGHSGVGLHKGDTYHTSPNNIKEVLFTVLKYALLAVTILLIAIFSIFRVAGVSIQG